MSGNIEPLFLVDSNVLVYAYDTTDPKKHQKAKALLEKCWQKKVKYAVSSQNLAEFFITTTKKISAPLSLEEAEKIINDIISFHAWNLVSYNEKTVLKAISYQKEFKSHFWDALIVATMVEAGITHIYTENISDFKKFKIIEAVNPFS